MSITYGDLKEQIQRNWGRSDSDSNSTIMFYFNAAQRLLARSYDAPELQKAATPTLVASTRSYSLTSAWSITDLRKIYSLYLTANSRGYELEYVPPRVWDREVWPYIPNASDDIPRLYTLWSGSVSFHPAPDDAYSTNMRYYAEPTNATGDASTIEFSGMDEVLVELATGFCFLSMEDYAVGQQHLKTAEALLRKYGVEAEFSKDFHPRSGAQPIGTGQYWNDPFARRSP